MRDILPLHIVHIVLTVLISQAVSGQSYWSKRIDLQRGNDYGAQISVIENNKLLIQARGLCEINNNRCSGLIMIDTDGAVLWKAVLLDTLETNYFESTYIYKDTIYMNVDYTMSDSLDYAILTYDVHGNGIGRLNYFHPGLKEYHWARGLAGIGSRLYVHFVYKDNEQSHAREAIRAYSMPWTEEWEISIPNTFPNALWCDIEATSDSGLVVLYSSWQSPTHERNATVEKYDVQGNLEWETSFTALGNINDGWVKIANHPDGGYVGFCGFDTTALYVANRPSIIFKLDAFGKIEWERLDLDNEFELYDIFTTDNGDIIACGMAEDWPWTSDDPEYQAAYIVRYNSVGEEIWNRKIFDETDGGTYFELYSGIELTNNDLMFTGVISDSIFGTPEDPTPDNIWVIKLNSDGCLTEGCGEWQHITSAAKNLENSREYASFAVFPNPAFDGLFIGPKLGVNIPKGIYTVRIYDMQSHLIRNLELDPLIINKFNVNDLNPGMYIVTVWRDEVLAYSTRLTINAK